MAESDQQWWEKQSLMTGEAHQSRGTSATSPHHVPSKKKSLDVSTNGWTVWQGASIPNAFHGDLHARQQKRKLATEFEDEIEKRYRYVAKRQHHVEGALDKMKTQGEGLVPKSPRASKSPKKT